MLVKNLEIGKRNSSTCAPNFPRVNHKKRPQRSDSAVLGTYSRRYLTKVLEICVISVYHLNQSQNLDTAR